MNEANYPKPVIIVARFDEYYTICAWLKETKKVQKVVSA